jgi:hypothetical protein
VDDDGRIVWEEVSKMEEKKEGQKENRRNIRNEAYVAVANTEGAYLTSGHQRNIYDARQSLHRAGCAAKFFS